MRSRGVRDAAQDTPSRSAARRNSLMQGGPGPLARSMALFPPRQTDSPIRDSPVPSPDELTASADKSLRFAIGERVQALSNSIGHLTRTSSEPTWQPGVVVRHWYWQGGAPMPYQVSLDNGSLVYAPNDSPKVIRALPAEECRNKRSYREGKNTPALTDRQHEEAEAVLEATEEAYDVSERGAEPCLNPQFQSLHLTPESRFHALWSTPKAAPAVVLQGGCICRHCRWWRLRDSALAVAQKRRDEEEAAARAAREAAAAAAARSEAERVRAARWLPQLQRELDALTERRRLTMERREQTERAAAQAAEAAAGAAAAAAKLREAHEEESARCEIWARSRGDVGEI